MSRHKSITEAFIYLSYELILQIAKLQTEKQSQSAIGTVLSLFFIVKNATSENVYAALQG